MTDPITGRPERPIRAPRGTALSCKGWPQEAALRMLMNNLDPDVAERWEDLVVYGGSGRPRATGRPITASCARSERLEDDETLLVQSGKPVGVFRRTPTRRACSSPTPCSCPRGRLGALPQVRGARPDDVRPDDRGLLDLHRHAGHPAGHLRDLRRLRGASTSAARSPGASCCPPGSGAWAARSRSPSP